MRSLLLHAGNEEVLQDGQDGQGWAPSYHPACRVHLPAAVWRVWMAEYYGPPLKARSVSFCLHQMVLADVSVAGLCSHRPARQPHRLFAVARTWRSSRWRFWELRY